MTIREYKILGAASAHSTEIELTDRALSGHSLQIERMTGLAQNLNLSRRSKCRGLRNTILTQLTLASNVGVEIYWGIHFHSCTNLELNRDANFVGPYFTIIS